LQKIFFFNFYYFSIFVLFLYSLLFVYSLLYWKITRDFFSPRVIGGWKPEYPEENHPSQSLKEVNQCLTRFGDPLPSKPNWYRTIGKPCICQAKPPSYGTKSWTWQSHGVRSQDIEFPQMRSWALNRSSPGLHPETEVIGQQQNHRLGHGPAESSLITFLLLQPVLNFPVPTPWKIIFPTLIIS